MTALRIRRLRLVGISRPYDVSFLNENGEVRRLSIIAGEISTGKTSILGFIAYCLGDSSFPAHPEIRSHVRSAQLECSLGGATFVIERSAGGAPSSTATVHSCAIDELGSPHPVVELVIDPPGNDDSLSQFLLGRFGLSEVKLKEAPTQDVSGAHKLSIRDLLRLLYVANRDLDGGQLMLESRVPVVRLKHQQVLDLMFLAHDNTAVSLAAQAKHLEDQIAAAQQELSAVSGFVQEQGVPTGEEIAERSAALEAQSERIAIQLAELEERMSSDASFGDEQRIAYQEAGVNARRLHAELRSNRTQLNRLGALAAQYDQDLKRLTFAAEASLLFDPLGVEICPWCLQPLPASEVGTADECSICHQAMPEDSDPIDVKRELSAVRRRHRELTIYLSGLADRTLEIELQLEEAVELRQAAQRRFDEMMQGRFSPYLAERDVLNDQLNDLSASRDDLARMGRMRASESRRRRDVADFRQQLADLKLTQLDAESKPADRDDAIERFAERFGGLLGDFRFPKLSEPTLDKNYVPSVHGTRYDRIGSSGAMTLITLAWYLALFELTSGDDGAHPGLLMIDSPQKNLKPVDGREEADDGFQSPSIANAVYRHLLDWAADSSIEGQLILVDNEPPSSAEAHVVVRYSGDPEIPPYGLIEDAIS